MFEETNESENGHRAEPAEPAAAEPRECGGPEIAPVFVTVKRDSIGAFAVGVLLGVLLAEWMLLREI